MHHHFMVVSLRLNFGLACGLREIVASGAEESICQLGQAVPLIPQRLNVGVLQVLIGPATLLRVLK